MSGLYLILLIVSLLGLLLIDRRYKLVFYYDALRARKVLLVSIAIFIAWDIVGIILGIFFIGKNNILIGLQYKNFPIEELAFLSLLTYTPLIMYRYLSEREQQKL